MGENVILLVEDSPTDEALTIRALRRNKVGNKLVIARDGAEALEHLLPSAPDVVPLKPMLVLLDLKLPKVDGLEVLRRLRADERTKRLPIVILTSSTEDSDIQRGYDLGVNSYVQKPVDFAQFVEAVRLVGLYWLMVNESPVLAAS